MKRLLAVALIAVMLLGLCACNVNDNEVSILWSGEHDVAVVPDSLINAMDRAMYIESVSYKHFAAKGDQAAQTQQAEACLNAGCDALMVELVDPTAAQSIVDMAKAKNVPVVFFGCDVDAAVVASYDKCGLVITDEATLAETYTGMVNDYVAKQLEKQGDKPNGIDKDLDGKVTCLVLGDIAVEGDNLICLSGSLEELTVQTSTEDKTTFFFIHSVEERGTLVNAEGKVIEAILADNDVQTLDMLVHLQSLGFNANQLSTHFVPLFTVGADADYKDYVLSSLPSENRQAYLESMMHLVDMTAIEQSEWENWDKKAENEIDSMVYNTLNQISAGKICGSAIEDYDAVAGAAAKLVADLISGEAVAESTVKVPYTVSVTG